jgi:competence protein ComEA
MSYKRFISHYLNFTTREKMGFKGLLFIIALLYFLPDIFYRFQLNSIDLLSFNYQMDSFRKKESRIHYDDFSQSKFKAEPKFTPFYFDPNQVDPKDLRKFGLSEKVIHHFVNYRKAGAKFYVKEDLRKVYGLKPELFNKMAPYVKFIKSQELSVNKNIIKGMDENFPSKHLVSKESKRIELNTADSLELLNIKGIGPYLSSKIINYRDALGGYVALEQLYEIFGVKKEQLDMVKNSLTVNSTLIKRLNINTANYYQLNRHPYISSKEANIIINYRKQHGLYTSSADLEKVLILSKEWIEKMNIYFEY